jgi:hypothetical protein
MILEGQRSPSVLTHPVETTAGAPWGSEEGSILEMDRKDANVCQGLAQLLARTIYLNFMGNVF